MPTYPVNQMGVRGGAARGYAQGAQQRFGNQLALRQNALQERQQQHAEKSTKEQEDRLRRQLQHDIEYAQQQMGFNWAQLDAKKQADLMTSINQYEQNRLTARGQDFTKDVAIYNASVDWNLTHLRENRADVRVGQEYVNTYTNNYLKSKWDYLNGLGLNQDQQERTWQTILKEVNLKRQTALEEDAREREKEARQMRTLGQIAPWVEPGGGIKVGEVSLTKGTPPQPKERNPYYDPYQTEKMQLQAQQEMGAGVYKAAQGLTPQFRLQIAKYATEMVMGSGNPMPPNVQEQEKIATYANQLEQYYSQQQGGAQGGGQGGGQPQGESPIVAQARSVGVSDQVIQAYLSRPNGEELLSEFIQSYTGTRAAFQGQPSAQGTLGGRGRFVTGSNAAPVPPGPRRGFAPPNAGQMRTPLPSGYSKSAR